MSQSPLVVSVIGGCIARCLLLIRKSCVFVISKMYLKMLYFWVIEYIIKILSFCVSFPIEISNIFMQRKLVKNVICLRKFITQKIYSFESVLGSRKFEVNAIYSWFELVQKILNILIHFCAIFASERQKHVSIHFLNIFRPEKNGLSAVYVKCDLRSFCASCTRANCGMRSQLLFL